MKIDLALTRRITWLLLWMALSMVVGPAWAEDTLSKIRDSGRVTVGVRDASGALSYFVGGANAYIGYQVDICKRVLFDIQKKLRLPELTIRYQPVTAQNRMLLVQNGTVDIECGSTANTAARQRDVAFSYTTFVEEVRIAVRASSGIKSVNELAGKRVVTTAGSTSVQALRRLAQATGMHFDETLAPGHPESFLLLESGRADAFAMDDQILAGLIANAKDPAAYRIVGEPLAIEPIGIMFRKDDPAFREAVDRSIAGLFGRHEIGAIYAKWFLQPIPPGNMRLNLEASRLTRAAWAKPSDLPADEVPKP